MITMPGKSPYHGAWWRNERPVFSMEPQEGVGGWVPSPRNESAASRSIATAPVTATWTTMGVSALSRMVRNIRYAGPTPSARVATTKSRSLSESVLARVRRANEGMLTTPTASMALNEPGPRIAMMTMASRIAGTARRKSSTRMIAASASPPAKPPRSPSGTPTIPPISTATAPVRSEMRAPWITRLRMSRPNSSVPKGWARDGDRNWSARLWTRGSWGAIQGARTAMTPSTDNMTHAASPARCRPSPRGRANHGREQSTWGVSRPARRPGARPDAGAERRLRDRPWHGCCSRKLGGRFWPEAETRGGMARPSTEEEPR